MITEIIDRIIEVRATNFPRNGFSFDTRMNYPVMHRQRRDTGKQTLEEISVTWTVNCGRLLHVPCVDHLKVNSPMTPDISVNRGRPCIRCRHL